VKVTRESPLKPVQALPDRREATDSIVQSGI